MAKAGLAVCRVAGPLPRQRTSSSQRLGVSPQPSRTAAPRIAERGRAALPVRILVDQSSYDLLNIGDVAMLQSCVTRLRSQWPDAEIMVIAHEPQRLATYCPGTIAIGQTFDGLPLFRILPEEAPAHA